MNCAAVERYVDAVVDQEVDPSTRIAIEEHTVACDVCRDRVAFARWMKGRLQLDGKLAAPAALRARVQQSLAAEAAAGGQDGSSLLPSFARLESSWRATAAFAAVALVVFGIGGALELKGQRTMARVGPLFEDVVRAHTRPYPAEVARRDLVPAYFADKVDFAVRPVDFSDPAVRFVGARHAEVGGRHAVTPSRTRSTSASTPPGDACAMCTSARTWCRSWSMVASCTQWWAISTPKMVYDSRAKPTCIETAARHRRVARRRRPRRSPASAHTTPRFMRVTDRKRTVSARAGR